MKQPNIINLFRCTERQYAESFCEKGNMKFNTPGYWIELEKEEGKGRGDLLEGVCASVHKEDIPMLAQLKDIRENICGETIDNITYLRSKDILELPSYCFFGLDVKDFSDVKGDKYGQNKYQTTVIQQYFKDFSDNTTKEVAKELPMHKQPVLVMINNPNKFFERLINYLIELGLKREEILINPVEYIDKSKGFYSLKELYPGELFLKDSSFEYQREVRVVINTKNKEILSKLSSNNNIINIGDLSDIANIEEFYYDKDMLIQKEENTLIYLLPEEKVYPLDEVEKMDLLGIAQAIISDEKDQCGYKTDEEKEALMKNIEEVLMRNYNIEILWEECIARHV
ncbi:hypothetical protein VN21_16940 [Paraclostridium benzoelyticum]|uniref:Uncharacterized protein n=1 Tax=Paraclostridium benzoelyticum TaxID=1629550 RepID=A0A0M3DEZ8_9FIRM|nr:hypothetical protein [Paraclostridium benzoelyticum]KKX99936.1 hypothetical protein VN21_16940 [Paraclostridium benzoelyticum]